MVLTTAICVFLGLRGQGGRRPPRELLAPVSGVAGKDLQRLSMWGLPYVIFKKAVDWGAGWPLIWTGSSQDLWRRKVLLGLVSP